MAQPLKIAVLLSGGGRTLANLTEHMASEHLPIQIVLVVSSNSKAYGLKLAADLGFKSLTLNPKDYTDQAQYSQQLFDQLRSARAELVCLAGWLWLLEIPDDFAHRVVNIHPALLPSFGGTGMYGHHVHGAVLAAGCKISGCTVHFADQTYDTGPIIVQRTCKVREDDTPDSLASRVFEQECIAYPQALRLIAQRHVRIEGRCTRIRQSCRA